MFQNHDYYNGIAPGYNELYGDEQSKKWNSSKELLTFSKEDIVLDFGCGTGLITKEIARRVKLVFGTDSSVKMLELAPGIENVVYFLTDSSELPFPDNHFTKAVSFTVMQDIKEWEPVLSEIRRVVDGPVLITFLKRNFVLEDIKARIEKFFKIEKFLEEEKDFIFVLNQ